MQVILQVIVIYDTQVKEELKKLVRKAKLPPERPEAHVFVGRSSHESMLTTLLDLIEFLVLSSEWQVNIGAANLDTLWKQFVLAPNFTTDQNHFLTWVNKRRVRQPLNPYSIHANRPAAEVHIFSPDEQKHLFTQIMCNPTFIDFAKISSAQARCFHSFFKVINRQEGSLDSSSRTLEVVDLSALIGVDCLWNMALQSETEKIREETRELLVDIHLKLSESYT